MGDITVSDKTYRLISFGYLSVLCCWLLVVSVQLAALYMDKYPLPIDFVHFLAVAQNFFSANRHQLYDVSVHTAALNRLAYPAHFEPGSINVAHCVPHIAFIVWPFLKMSLTPAYIIWVTLQIVLGSASIWMLARGSVSHKIFVLLLAFSSFPSTQNFWFGQMSWIVFAITSLFCLAMIKKSFPLQLLALGLATFKLQYLPFLVVPSLIRGFRRLFAALAIIYCLLAGALFLYLGPDGLASYLRNLAAPDSTVPSMVSLRILFHNLGAGTGSSIVALIVIPGLVLVAWTWLTIKEHPELELLPWALALTVLAALVFSPHTLGYDCVVLFVAAALTLPELRSSKEFYQCPPALKVWCLLFYAYPIVSWLLFLWRSQYEVGILAVNVMLLAIGMLCLPEALKQQV